MAPTSTTELSPDDVYSRVAPSVPFIETATGTGSGVLIEGGYVVTNYHVVWPHDAVWVVFPDGTELQGVPVIGWDPLADLAVLGPVDVSAPPLRLADGESMVPGSEVYLVGYPAEVDLFPVASITRGILSRFREWERLGMTYLQTDAAIAGGQSGGALVDSEGNVVGISTFSFSEAGFGLATSASDDIAIVDRLIQGGSTSPHERRISSEGGHFEFDVELSNVWDSQTFIFEAAGGSIHVFSLDGVGDGAFRVFDSFGLVLEVDDNYTGSESGHIEVQTEGIHFLQVETLSRGASIYSVRSSIRMRPFIDPDNGRPLEVGDTLIGTLEPFADWDWYSLWLNSGETIRVFTDSLNVDTLVYIAFPGSTSEQISYDDDSGGGLSGTDSEITYSAPFTGEYYLVVTGALDNEIGGYFLTVEASTGSAQLTPVIPDASDGRFESLLSESPILMEMDPDTLRDIAVSRCILLDDGMTMYDLFLVTVSEAAETWDLDTVHTFLAVAVYGLCPEYTEEVEEWLAQSTNDIFIDRLTFDVLMVTEPVLSSYQLEPLRELAMWVCDTADANTGFDDIYSSIYAESPADWDWGTSLGFMFAAVHGFCPEHVEALDRWAGEA